MLASDLPAIDVSCCGGVDELDGKNVSRIISKIKDQTFGEVLKHERNSRGAPNSIRRKHAYREIFNDHDICQRCCMRLVHAIVVFPSNVEATCANALYRLSLVPL